MDDSKVGPSIESTNPDCLHDRPPNKTSLSFRKLKSIRIPELLEQNATNAPRSKIYSDTMNNKVSSTLLPFF
uniref:Uncharacterized protein n=1 Tax=Nelumbo nucifera TaxID=4432 RepID=A0A822Y2U1_NELNU|nr:TPA_asm: hypothetical protein HUJ06_027339 [Nelumbo nucifera]